MHAVSEVAGALPFPVLGRAVRRMAFGCEPLGGYNWGHVDNAAIEAAIETALNDDPAKGAMIFDTADTYGPHLSEERLGRCLAGHRKGAVLATKFGVRLSDGQAWYDTSPAYADQALDASLARLGTDYIDLYQLHWPDDTTPLPETLNALEGFRAEGRIRAYGVSNVAPKDLLPLLGDFPGLASFSLGYSLLDREAEAGISAVCGQGLVFLAYGCLSQGLLSGKYKADTVFEGQDRRNNPKYHNFHGDQLVRNLKIVDELKVEAKRLESPVPALALAFVLEQLPRAIPLVGIKSTEQLMQNLMALSIAVDQNTLARLGKASQ